MPVVSGKVSCTAAPEIGIFVWEAETSKIVDYDHDTKSWGTNVPPVPSNGLTSGRLTVLQNGSVLFVGGYRSGRGVDATYLYTPSLTAWSSGQHMLAGRSVSASCSRSAGWARDVPRVCEGRLFPV